VTVKGLFRDHNEPRFDQAKEHLNKGDRESLLDATVICSEVLEDPSSSESDERRAFWIRGLCQQKLARLANPLRDVLLYLESARTDFSKAIIAEPRYFSSAMKSQNFFPEHPMFLPAYVDYLQQVPHDQNRHYTGVLAQLPPSYRMEKAFSAIAAMGREAESILPVVESAYNTIQEHVLPSFESAFKRAIRRLTDTAQGDPTSQIHSLHAQVVAAFDSFPNQREEVSFTDQDLARNERELVALLSDSDWIERAKAVCILRCKVKAPEPATIEALYQHLGRTEKRANVRGQCIFGLLQVSTAGLLSREMQDKFTRALLERLRDDSAYPVQGIAAKALSQISPQSTEVIEALVSVLSEAKIKNNLKLDLVEAVGRCGTAARHALPLVRQFEPSNWHGFHGHCARSIALVQLSDENSPEALQELEVVANAVRQSPIAQMSGGTSRSDRSIALNALLQLPMDETLRTKLFVERMMLDESAAVRCEAAHGLIKINQEFATTAGAYRTLELIGG
jgi:HEAT repeat protein